MLRFFAVPLIFCIALCEGRYAQLDPSCGRDQSGRPRKCIGTTKSRKCPNIAQYYKEVDEEIVCCCQCRKDYCTTEPSDSVICHKEYCPTAPTSSTPVEVISSTSTATPNNTTVGLITRILPVTSAAPEAESTVQEDRRGTTDIQTEDTPTTPEDKDEETMPESKNDPPTDPTVGIVIGVVVVVCIGVGVVLVFLLRNKGMCGALRDPPPQDPPLSPKPEEKILLQPVHDAA